MGKKLDTQYKRIHFVNHSHVDHTWWNSPEVCQERNDEIINNILDLCAENPDFKFSYETTAALIGYLERNPGRKDDLSKLLKAGRLDVGSLFVSVNADVCSEEAIARNFYLGKRWLETTLGYSPAITKEYDTPGHTLQMPQLVRSAGMDVMVITRGPKGGFLWVGPDRSEIFTFCVPYNWSYWRKLGVDFEQTEKNLPAELERAAEHYAGPDLIIPDGDDMTMPNAQLLAIIEDWNKNYDSPELVLSTLEDCIENLRSKKFRRRAGDMPNIWAVIHALQIQPTHDMKMLQSLLPAAEALGVFLSLRKGNFKNYPAKEIESCWKRALLVADHNWGGKDKDSQGIEGDKFKAKSVKDGLNDCRRAIGLVFEGITYALTEKESLLGMPMLVFNPSSWKRTEPVSVEVTCSFQGLEGIEIVNPDDETVPFHLEVLERHDDDTIYKARADFLCRDLPSLGYSTYYAKPTIEKMEDSAEQQADDKIIENEFYRVEFFEDGSSIKSIYDKELDMELAGRFAVSVGPMEFEFGMFELFGIGMRLTVPEQSFFENPENEGTGESVELTGDFWHASDCPAEIKVEHRGRFSRSLIAEGEFHGSPYRRKVTLYEGIKRIDLHLDLDWKGQSNTALFLQMPNAFMDGQTYLDLPFAVHKNGEELSEFWIDESLPVKFKVRGIQDWLCFEKDGRGLAMATRWPIVDLTMVPGFPLMWTNDDSGFFIGERYRQAGKHSFDFSLTSYDGTWQDNAIHQWGKQWAKQPLTLLTEDAPDEESRSYISVDSANIVITAFKKAEDEDAIVVRLYEATGKKTATRLNASFLIKQAQTTNLIETTAKKLAVQKDSIKLSFRPFEIKTIKLYPQFPAS